MSKLELDAQYDLAAKIQNLIMFVGLLSDDEIEALKELRENLAESSSRISSVAGVLVPIEKANHKLARHEAMIKRINGFIMIAESNDEIMDADVRLDAEQKGKADIERLFGL